MGAGGLVGGEPLGYAQVTVVANAPPSSGSAVVRACDERGPSEQCPSGCCGGAEGFAALTDFQLASEYWVDDAEDLPLQYSFASVPAPSASATATGSGQDDGDGRSSESPLGFLCPSNRLKVCGRLC